MLTSQLQNYRREWPLSSYGNGKSIQAKGKRKEKRGKRSHDQVGENVTGTFFHAKGATCHYYTVTLKIFHDKVNGKE